MAWPALRAADIALSNSGVQRDIPRDRPTSSWPTCGVKYTVHLMHQPSVTADVLRVSKQRRIDIDREDVK